MSHLPYRIVVRWSDADEAYVAEVPALPGAGGDGPTLQKAVKAVEKSVQDFLRIMKKHGDPIPPPDLSEGEYSGQIRLRMPKSLHRELAQAAEREGVSLNQLMVTLLARRWPEAQSLPSNPITWFPASLHLQCHEGTRVYSQHGISSATPARAWRQVPALLDAPTASTSDLVIN